MVVRPRTSGPLPHAYAMIKLRPHLFHCSGATTREPNDMLYLVLKAGLSGIIVALVSEIARRNPGIGGLIASLPLVSILGMIWLWRDTEDVQRLAAHSAATFWFVLPSMPMFLLLPELLKRGVGFWPSLFAACILTVALYSLMVWIGPRLGLRL